MKPSNIIGAFIAGLFHVFLLYALFVVVGFFAAMAFASDGTDMLTNGQYLEAVLALINGAKGGGSFAIAFAVSQAIVLSFRADFIAKKFWDKLSGNKKMLYFTIISTIAAFISAKHIDGLSILDAAKQAGLYSIVMQFLYNVYVRYIKPRLEKIIK